MPGKAHEQDLEQEKQHEAGHEKSDVAQKFFSDGLVAGLRERLSAEAVSLISTAGGGVFRDSRFRVFPVVERLRSAALESRLQTVDVCFRCVRDGIVVD